MRYGSCFISFGSWACWLGFQLSKLKGQSLEAKMMIMPQHATMQNAKAQTSERSTYPCFHKIELSSVIKSPRKPASSRQLSPMLIPHVKWHAWTIQEQNQNSESTAKSTAHKNRHFCWAWAVLYTFQKTLFGLTALMWVVAVLLCFVKLWISACPFCSPFAD